MYEYKKGQKPMLFKMPSGVSSFEETTIDTNDKYIFFMEFFEEHKGVFIIKVLDKTIGKYDTIYSNVELKLNEDDPVIDYYEFQVSE